MASRMADSVFVRAVNAVAVGLMGVPLLGRLVGRGLVLIRYTGRHSGKTFEIPVAYRRSGDRVVIGVGMPERKNWWRNFLGEGGPITLIDLDGADRGGHAIAARSPDGAVSVSVLLDVR